MRVTIQTIRVWEVECADTDDGELPADVYDWPIEYIESKGKMRDAMTEHAEVTEHPRRAGTCARCGGVVRPDGGCACMPVPSEDAPDFTTEEADEFLADEQHNFSD